MRSGRSILAVVLALAGVAPRPAGAQGPTVPGGAGDGSARGRTTLGPIPGAGGQGAASPGDDSGQIGGRPGVSVGRTRRRTNQGPARGGLADRVTLPQALPEVEDAPASIPLALPGAAGADDGPADGLTLDAAIERLIRENLDLKAQFHELPMAEADVLTAGLRANPVFYADSQLIPYGGYSNKRPGGPVQYDVNVSMPLDVSRKRQARTASAAEVRRALGLQYQDAVRLQIGNLYAAFVDALLARETVRYARANVKGVEPVLEAVVDLSRRGLKSLAEVDRVKILRENAVTGLDDAEEEYDDARRTIAGLLNLPPAQGESFEIRGTLRDLAPAPPGQDELTRIALSCRPDLAALRAGIGQSQADVRLAKANRYEDLYLLYQPYTFQDISPFNAKSSHSWALGVTVPLPVWNRNQGNIRRAELNVSQSQAELAALERRVLTEVRRAVREYGVSKSSATRVETLVLPVARELRDDLVNLLPKGETEVVDALNAQREYNDAVRQFRDALGRHRRSMLDLNTAVGRRILP